MSETLGILVGLIFTLLVFSYLLGDNAFFRLAVHIFIGAAAGYILAVLVSNILFTRLVTPLITGSSDERLAALIPLVLSVLLLTKATPRLSGLGSPVMALLAGVGAAVVVTGAVTGTLIPQAAATINLFSPSGLVREGGFSSLELLNAIIILVGAVMTLAYFRFHIHAPQPVYSQAIGWVGRTMVAITLGVLFAGVYMAALTALVERLGEWVAFVQGLL